MTRRSARVVLLLVLAVCASSMAFFFDSANPNVVLFALAAWCCLMVAIWKVPRP